MEERDEVSRGEGSLTGWLQWEQDPPRCCWGEFWWNPAVVWRRRRQWYWGRAEVRAEPRPWWGRSSWSLTDQHSENNFSFCRGSSDLKSKNANGNEELRTSTTLLPVSLFLSKSMLLRLWTLSWRLQRILKLTYTHQGCKLSIDSLIVSWSSSFDPMPFFLIENLNFTMRNVWGPNYFTLQ